MAFTSAASQLISGLGGRSKHGQMSNSEEVRHVRTDVILQMASIVVFWLIAFIVWWASLWHADLYSGFGADLPVLTKAIVWSAKVGLPFVLAALFSAVVAFQIRRSGHRSVVVAAWLLVAFILCTAFAMVGMTQPMIKMCGEVVPGWPSSIFESEGGHGCGD